MLDKGLQIILRKKNIDMAIIANLRNTDPNLFYFTGIELEYSFLFIPKKGNSLLLTHKLEYERAKKYSMVRDVRLMEKPVIENIAKMLARRGTNIGLNFSVISINAFRELRRHLKGKKFHDISTELMHARQAKQHSEVKILKKACNITDSIFSELITNFNFRTEMDVERFLHSQAQKHGCTMSFPPIVASGSNASMPHYRARNVKLKKGFLILDYGINYKGYMSDMTRTIYIGKPSAQEKELYNLLLRVQKGAITMARPGMEVSQISSYVRKGLGKYNEYFIHSLGHGIGVEIHELPTIHGESKDVFGVGDVFTVEPGIYLPGKLGIRIEDDVLMTKHGPVVLSKSKKALVSLSMR